MNLLSQVCYNEVTMKLKKKWEKKDIRKKKASAEQDTEQLICAFTFIFSKAAILLNQQYA